MLNSPKKEEEIQIVRSPQPFHVPDLNLNASPSSKNSSPKIRPTSPESTLSKSSSGSWPSSGKSEDLQTVPLITPRLVDTEIMLHMTDDQNKNLKAGKVMGFLATTVGISVGVAKVLTTPEAIGFIKTSLDWAEENTHIPSMVIAAVGSVAAIAATYGALKLSMYVGNKAQEKLPEGSPLSFFSNLTKKTETQSEAQYYQAIVDQHV